MADRKVSVGLELKAAGFKAEATAAEEKIESLDRKVDKLDRSITKIPPDAAKAAAAMKLLGDEGGRAGAKFDEFGQRTTSLQQVDQRIIKTRGEVRALAEEFNRTGDVHVLERMFGKQGELKELESFRNRITVGLGDAGTEGGKEFAKNFSSTSQGILSTPGVGPIVAGAIVAAVVTALPAINGALLGVTGLGGIGLGIAGQLRDPKVRGAFGDMGHDLADTLTSATTAFRAPLLGSISIFGDALKGLIHSIDFTSLAKSVAPFISGIANMISAIGPGLNKAFVAAGPILKALAEDLPMLGHAISDMFEMFAMGGKGAQEALRALIGVLAALVFGVGAVVLGFSKLFEWFVSAGEAISHFEAKVSDSIPVLGHLFRLAEDFFHSLNGDNDVVVTARNLHGMGDAAKESADNFEKLSQATRGFHTESALIGQAVGYVFDRLMSVDQATIAWHESLLSLRDTIRQNGLAIDSHTGKINENSKAGLENEKAILAVVQANMATYQSQIAVGMSAQDAAAQYDKNTRALEAQLRNLGYAPAAIDAMIGKYKQIPDQMNVAASMDNLTSAIDRLNTALRKLAGLQTSKEINIKVNYYERVFGSPNSPTSLPHVSPENRRWGGITEHAQAGLLRDAGAFRSGPLYAFAEPATGGEAFVPRFGDYRRSTSILDQAARWYGGRFAPGGMGGAATVVNASVTINAGIGANGIQLGQQVADVLRPFINASGGNVQVALGRRGQ